MLFLCFSLISFSAIPIFAQNDDFDIGTEDWPDIPIEETKESEPAFEPIESEPVSEPVKSKTVSEPVKNAPVAEPKEIAPAVEPQQAEVAKPVESTKPIVEETPMETKTYSSSVSKSESKSSIQSYVASSKTKRAGPPLVVIARPTYAPYSTEEKTMYISSVTEAYYHFKLGALTAVQVVPQQKLFNNLQYYRDFTRRLSRATYIEAAKKMGASFLIYQEYEPQGKNVQFNIELFSIDQNQKLYAEKKIVNLGEFEAGLFECINDVAVTMVNEIPGNINKVLMEDVIGNNSKAIEALGSLIISEGDYSKKRSETASANLEKFCNQNPKILLATFVAANVFARAGKHEKAVEYQRKLISTFGSGYPGLYLKIADYYRMAENYNDALDAAEESKRSSDLDLPASAMIASIYEAKGDLSRAQNEYQSILSKGGEDGNIYFQLALVSIGLNKISQANNYLSKAASAGRDLDRGDYYEIGLRYSEIDANEQAVEAFKNSLGIQQDNEDAWLRLAELYTKMNKQSDAADCYVSLFHMNNTANKDYLVKAGLTYESLNMNDRAKDAYELFLARKFVNPEVSVRLAKIEAQNNNCRRSIELVENIDTNSVLGSDIKAIFEQCKAERRPVIITQNDPAQKGWAAVFAWRMASAVITAAGAGLGYYFNTQVDDVKDKYLAFDDNKSDNPARNPEEVKKMHSDIEKFQLLRNLCYAGGCVGVASLSASIVLPIIIRK